MKKLYILLVFCIVIILSGCNRYEQEYSDNMEATGTVTVVDHEDSHSEYSLDFNGKLVLKNIPENFEVEITWEHGVITLDTEEDYEKFCELEGREVYIKYCEVYWLEYDHDTGKLINKSISDYKVIDIILG